MAVAPRRPTTASKQPAAAAAVTTIFLPRGISAMAAFFAAVPALTILAIGIAVMRNALPLPLTALLAIVACSCGYWIKIALPQLGDINNRLSALTSEVRRAVAATASIAPVIMPSKPGRTTFSVNSGFYQGRSGAGFGFAHRLDVAVPLMVHGGYSNGGGSAHIGRVGMAVEF